MYFISRSLLLKCICAFDVMSSVEYIGTVFTTELQHFISVASCTSASVTLMALFSCVSVDGKVTSQLPTTIWARTFQYFNNFTYDLFSVVDG